MSGILKKADTGDLVPSIREQGHIYMSERHVEGFFYGLFMDVSVLGKSGVAPVNARRAYVDDFALRIGKRATLVSSLDARAYGMLIALTHPQLERLYGAPGLEQYRPEAILARPLDGGSVPALCYNLIDAPQADEKNPDYAVRLQQILRELQFPTEYVDSVSRA
jgi:hypothetical protein